MIVRRIACSGTACSGLACSGLACPGLASIRRMLAAALLCLLLAGAAQADERILSYDSAIAIASDGSMEVTETVRVRAEGQQIRRGIYRDFPTDYRDAGGNRIRVAFEFLDAKRDGATEAWRAESGGNGVRVYLGRSGHLLARGEYTYTLRYRTNRQLYFGSDHDELYWNVTGNGWAFRIDSASARVTLPQPVPATRLRAFGFTGAQGSLEAALEASTIDGGGRWQSTRGLAPQEGMSLVLEFPKGIVAEPDAREKIGWLLHDNRHLLAMLAGLALLWAWYGWMWHRHGRDPARGVRMPLYEPPNGYSPASLRFVREMGYDDECLAAALISLASKGALQIHEDEKHTITLRKDSGGSRLSHDESALQRTLFSGRHLLELKKSSSTAKVMQKVKSAHQAALSASYETKYFLTNGKVLIVGVLLSLLVLLGGVWLAPGEMRFVIGFMLLWLSFWSVGVYALVSAAWTATRASRGIGSGVGAVGLWLFALPFVGGELAGLGVLVATAGIGFVCAFVVLLGTNLAFHHWMKAPTQLGARLLDQIDGFRWFLGVAEKQELDSRYQPEARPELFAQYLPYALALDVGNGWAERFASSLGPEQLAQAQPAWYHSSSGLSAGALTGMASNLGSSLGNAISSASTAPGSSSGSGGGGSGGGGGGGGGGGW